MVASGSIFSSVWIIIANSWQQTPAGHQIVTAVRNGLTVTRAETADFWGVRVQSFHGGAADAHADRRIRARVLFRHEHLGLVSAEAESMRSSRAAPFPEL